MRSLVIYERIKTTEAKAKAIKGEIEKLVTKAKNKGEQARVYLGKYFSKDIINKIVLDIAPRFQNRKGGYTRILKIGRRLKNNAKMVLLEWVEKKTESNKSKTENKIKEEPETREQKLNKDKVFKNENKTKSDKSKNPKSKNKDLKINKKKTNKPEKKKNE